MSANSPTVSGAYALHLIELAARRGISVARVVDGTEVMPEALALPGARIRLCDLLDMSKRVARWIDEPVLPVVLGRGLFAASHGSLGVALLTAETVGASMATGARYLATRSTAMSAQLLIADERAAMILSTSDPVVGEAREFAILLGLVILLAIADTIAGQPLAARATCSLREPRGAELYPELSRVEFGAPENGIVLLASTLAWRLPLADAVAHRIAVAECERELAALGSTGNVAMRVRNALPNGDGFRSLEELAKCLHFSARSLKRRLASEGTSYREIVDDLRRQNALLSLADVGTTIEEVGARLGYSDTQSFVRAFRRWTDMTPSAYRAKRRFSERRGT